MGCLQIKSLWLVFTYRAKLIITCMGKKKTPVILSLFALVRKAQEGGRESVELAAMFSWAVWRPVAAYCVRRDEDVERQRDGFKAWQRLLGFSTAAML